ncbi:hypothetical protein A5gp_00041 [Alteromonas phage vB_AemP_PT15-A5]|nr:hypothetical protein A5gp_00041 [Alteromonas phage vB_AemP_PT15-A5]
MASFYRNSLNLRFKTDFTQKLLIELFASFETAMQTRIDAVVQQQFAIAWKNRKSEDDEVKIVGYKLESKTFLHSNVIGQVNLSYMQLLSDRIPELDPSLIEEGLSILELKSKKDHDLMKFKAMINSFMSVCRNLADFVVVFTPLFPEATANYLTEIGFNKYFLETAKKHTTLTADDGNFVNEVKERFEAEYNRYKFMKNIVGV